MQEQYRTVAPSVQNEEDLALDDDRWYSTVHILVKLTLTNNSVERKLINRYLGKSEYQRIHIFYK